MNKTKDPITADYGTDKLKEENAAGAGGFARFAHAYGLHPLVAVAMLATDQMLFITLELPTLEALSIVSMAVGLVLTLPCILIQRYSYKDDWGAACGKGLMVGALTAIPTSLPSIITAGWGILGLIGMRARPTGLPEAPAPKHGV